MSEIDAALKQVATTDKALASARVQAAERVKVAQGRRDNAVRDAHNAGASYRQIAAVLGVAHNYVYEICNKET